MPVTTQIRSNDMIDSLDKERGGKDKSSLVSPNESLKNLSKGLEKVLALNTRNLINTNESYDTSARTIYDVCSVIAPEPYIYRDIESFAVNLPQFNNVEPDILGLYLSWLINNSPDPLFRLNIGAFDNKISHLGYLNRGKNIEVSGDLGYECGAWMYSGKIKVAGNVGRSAGAHMHGGSLEILGNAGEHAAEHMESGAIIVRGNCGQEAGYNMHGGELHIYGDVQSFGSVLGTAKVFHKGKLVHQGDNKCPF